MDFFSFVYVMHIFYLIECINNLNVKTEIVIKTEIRNLKS